MVPLTPAPKAPEISFKVKSSCTKGTEEKFASNGGRGGGGGVQGGGLPPMVVSRSNTSLWLGPGQSRPVDAGVFLLGLQAGDTGDKGKALNRYQQVPDAAPSPPKRPC